MKARWTTLSEKKVFCRLKARAYRAAGKLERQKNKPGKWANLGAERHRGFLENNSAKDRGKIRSHFQCNIRGKKEQGGPRAQQTAAR